MTTPSDDKPKWREFWLGRTDMARDYIREYAPDDQREYIHVIESAAVVAAEAQLTDCNKIINNLHQQVQRAEAEIARMKEGLNSPAEQAMQGTCEVCGTMWRSDEFLPCPVCKPALAGQCLNCDAEFEMSNSGCMDLLRKERAKLTEAEREIADLNGFIKGLYDAAEKSDAFYKAQIDLLIKENAGLNETCMRMANERLDVEWPLVQENLRLTKQTEEQAKEIAFAKEMYAIASDKLIKQNEIIAVLEAALENIKASGHEDRCPLGGTNSTQSCVCALGIAAEALDKLSEFRGKK